MDIQGKKRSPIKKEILFPNHLASSWNEYSTKIYKRGTIIGNSIPNRNDFNPDHAKITHKMLPNKAKKNA